MSKAEERALEKYPLMSDDDKEGLEAIERIVKECDCISEYNELQEAKQAYFIEGYHQAEKDLELTVDDIMKIDALLIEMWNQSGNKYQEVLKQFKEGKKNDRIQI